MEKVKFSDLIDKINSHKLGIQYVFCATFEFDYKTMLEEIIEKTKFSKNCRVLIFMDGKKYHSCKTPHNVKMSVKPEFIHKKSLFHPKTYLFVTEENNRGERFFGAYVGSANLTRGGIGGNNLETGIWADNIGDPTIPEWRKNLIDGVIKFFEQMLQDTKKDPSSEMKFKNWSSFLEENIAKDVDQNELTCHTSFNDSIFNQLRDKHKMSRCNDLICDELIVVTPFRDKNICSFIDHLEKVKSVFGKIKNKKLVTSFDNIEEYEELKVEIEKNKWNLCRLSNDGKSARLHAKMIATSYGSGREWWIVQGSANITSPGFFKSVHARGNVEFVTIAHHVGKIASEICGFLKTKMHKSDEIHEFPQETTTEETAVANAYYYKENRNLICEIIQPSNTINAEREKLEVTFKKSFAKKKSLKTELVLDKDKSTGGIVEKGEKCPVTKVYRSTLAGEEKFEYDTLKFLRAPDNLRFKEVPITIISESELHDETTENPWETSFTFRADRNKQKSSSIKGRTAQGPDNIKRPDVWPLLDEVSRRLIKLERYLENELQDGKQYLPGSPLDERLTAIKSERVGLQRIIDDVQRTWNKNCKEQNKLRAPLQKYIEEWVGMMEEKYKQKDK